MANKLDEDSPHPSGTSRVGAIQSYLLDKYKESIEFDKWARKNQYRTMILQTPKFTENDDSDFPHYSSAEESDSIDSD